MLTVDRSRGLIAQISVGRAVQVPLSVKRKGDHDDMMCPG